MNHEQRGTPAAYLDTKIESGVDSKGASGI